MNRTIRVFTQVVCRKTLTLEIGGLCKDILRGLVLLFFALVLALTMLSSHYLEFSDYKPTLLMWFFFECELFTFQSLSPRTGGKVASQWWAIPAPPPSVLLLQESSCSRWALGSTQPSFGVVPLSDCASPWVSWPCTPVWWILLVSFYLYALSSPYFTAEKPAMPKIIKCWRGRR